MQRRLRVDLGQQTSTKKEENILDRKRTRWAARNKDRPNENPFVAAIKPELDQYGEQGESSEQLRVRLENLEFGNFPGYFKYRNKSAGEQKDGSKTSSTNPSYEADKDVEPSQSDSNQNGASTSIDSGLSDERLQHFDERWFAGKEVLDIGCNRGHITYAVACLFRPKFIIGIDIDEKIVSMANRDLHLHLEDRIVDRSRDVRRERAAAQRLKTHESKDDHEICFVEDPDHFPLSCYINSGPLISIPQGDLANTRFPMNILFLEHNYVLSRDELVDKQKPYFDTIVCLSVTKWIHLNYRDEGLKRFFRRIFRHLRDGGLLVLEAQPFDNYSRRKRQSDRLKSNFYSIRFKPDEFDEYLMSKEVGFKEIIYNSITDHKCTGFKRPIKVYLK